MTLQPQAGGRRPIDRVLAPGFADDVTSLEFAELRSRRHLAEQEEVDLSYARRLLQGRLDLLRAEQAQRATARDGVDRGARTDREIARDLAAVLADSGPRADHGLGRHLTTDPSRVGEHRRAAEQAVDDVSASDPSSLSTRSARTGTGCRRSWTCSPPRWRVGTGTARRASRTCSRGTDRRLRRSAGRGGRRRVRRFTGLGLARR
jgi:hypothetical protein